MSSHGSGQMSTATTLTSEGVVGKPLKDIGEPIDPRLSLSSRPRDDQLDDGLVKQLSHLVHSEHHKGDLEKISVDSDEIIYFLAWVKQLKIKASCASTYNMGFPSMLRDLNCTPFQANVGLSVYALGFGVVPLVTASFSEEFGRHPLYLGSAVGFLLMYVVVAMANNIQTVIVGRLLQGAFGSTGATMVGGTITDIWSPRE
ncbi:hypothetical protein H0H81_008217 [Sphagnurus paluster]|uniref:Major facilitator superfamily (MFS) profile domain-containing protein n=1 Tax=Sphagnurus paluster TaxID=117069 RepID=A0A9P7KJ29_9AGAR|nr:hypothetical protein H0H81_008217 [Sphagnurus paluster]